MTFDEKTFNKWFNTFILTGMTVALVLATIIRFGSSSTGPVLLLVSAFGSLMGVLSTVCSANGNILTFLFGLLDVSIYGVVCFINWKNGGPGLGNAVLHALYFVPMQFVGLAQWHGRGARTSSAVTARRMDRRQRIRSVIALVLGTVLAYVVIAHFDKSAASSFLKVSVILDALPLVCNILGQMYMSMAYMEQWLFWIGVNIFSILMWADTLGSSGESYALIYVIKYAFYLINSLNGLRIWINLSRDGART